MQLKMDENMSTNEAPPLILKKKRSLPGHPDPNSEVIAMSPKSLIETNRFVCEICKKGFQRDQNLQLHRRGHNLPWKLKKRRDDDEVMMIKKKVYVCPEKTCVHNNPSRALGDLTGIKKHFFRKHGEKKWKCEKCSKCYAVHSDWKAHSKICGTREYRCDCGTLFSRRDSFITHRAFCDALAEESTTTTISSPSSSSAHITLLNPQLDQIHSNLFFNNINPTLEQDHQHINYLVNPPWLLPPPTPPLFAPKSDLTVLPPCPQYSTIANSAHMSAAELLQKAGEMGLISHNNKASQSTTASSGNGCIMIRPHHTHMSGLGLYSSRDQEIGNKAASTSSDDIILLHDYQHMMMMNIAGLGGPPPSSSSSSMMSSFSSSIGFDDDDEFHGFLLNLQTRRPYSNINNADQNSIEESQFTKSSTNDDDGLTRDFLGIDDQALPDHNKDFFSIGVASTLYGHQNQTQSQSPCQP